MKHFALVLGVLFFSITVRAQVWDGAGVAGGNLDWITATNWNPDGAPLNNGTANIVFAGNIDVTPNLDQNWSVNSLTFNNTAGAFVLGSAGGFTLTVGAGGITNDDGGTETIAHAVSLGAAQKFTTTAGALTVNGALNTNGRQLTLQPAASTAITLGGAVSGSGGLIKTDPGDAVLGGAAANTYTGLTTVNGGFLFLQKNPGVNALAGNLVISDNAGGTDGVILLNSNQIPNTTAVTVNAQGAFDVNNMVEGFLNLNVNGGAVTIQTGTLTIGATLLMTGGSVHSTGAGALVLSGNVNTLASVGSATISGNVNLGAGARTFQVNEGAAENDLEVSGVISNGTMVKTGLGQLRLGAANTFAGGLTITFGTIALGDDAAAGTGTLRISGGTIRADGGPRTLANSIELTTLGAGFAGEDALVLTGPVALNVGAGGYILNVTNTAVTSLSGVISNVGTGGLVKNGDGTLQFTGAAANTFTNDISVGAGTLVLNKPPNVIAVNGNIFLGNGIGTDTLIVNASEQIANSANVTLQNGAVLSLNADETIATLTVNQGSVQIGGGAMLATTGDVTINAGTVQQGTLELGGDVAAGLAPGTISSRIELGGLPREFDVADVSGITADLTASGAIVNGELLKTGTGTLLLSGSLGNSLTSTVVNQGLLQLGKAAGQNATAPSLNIFGGSVQLLADNQIPDNGNVTIGGSVLDLNGFTETIGGLAMQAGSVTTGAGTLTLSNNVTTLGSANTATIAGALNLGGTRTFTIADGAAATDLTIPAAVSNGVIVKEGPGSMLLTTPATIGMTVNAGAITGAITIPAGQSFIQNGGIFGGSVTNLGTFTYNGGAFDALLINHASVTFNASFTAEDGIENYSSMTVNALATLTANGPGLLNSGTLTLNSGTLAGSAVVNDIGGQLHARGTITAPFANHGATNVSGLLVITAAAANDGVISISSAETLRPVAGLANTGLIQLFGGAISGGTLSNLAPGIIRGNGGITSVMGVNAGLIDANNGSTLLISSMVGNASSGEIRVQADGSLNIVNAFSSAGLITLQGGSAALAGGTITNLGTIRGTGRISNSINNSGIIHAEPGLLSLSGPVSNLAAGRINVPAGATVLASSGVSSNAGLIALSGGRFDNNSTALDNSGQVFGFGDFAAGMTTNSGQFAFAGGISSVQAPLNNTATAKLILTNSATATFHSPIAGVSGTEIRVGAGSTAVFLAPVSGAITFTGTGIKFFEAGVSPVGPVAAMGTSVVQAGATLTTDHIREAALTIEGQVNIRPGSQVSEVAELIISPAGRLDLANNAILVDYSGPTPIEDIRAKILSGYAGGAWNGNGIFSSAAATDSSKAIGYAEANEIGLSGGSFGGLDVDNDALLIRLTIKGDANLDGQVSFIDLLTVAANFGQSGAHWNKGDFNYDAQVSFVDLLTVAARFGSALPGSIPGASDEFNAALAVSAAQVPEPGTLAWIGLGLLAILRRRKRQD